MNRKREDHIRIKREEAQARQEASDKRTSKQRIQKLNNLLGKDVGAQKERERLTKQSS